ncbi:putative RNA-binding protein [Desulfolithobacter dissulfuricans]|uniref:RNA-binding protein n=1 Tax=Desulfolithobacter dissulfuricans TaxID=2795293 RepID=A0A915U4P6_9BACT|nr:ribosome assembly RNA-binding protein YhbY [Desulfolithobacter dissulfuricans]BCO08077.1 putative RNA-binding protein [Desulfolithobacter dissulfuricans]
MADKKKKKAKSTPTLNSRQIRHLRSLGHHLDPVVLVGREGISESVIQSVRDALKTRELLKVKLGQNCPVGKKEAATEVAVRTGAVLVQLIGKTILLYQPNDDLPEKQRITLPR